MQGLDAGMGLAGMGLCGDRPPTEPRRSRVPRQSRAPKNWPFSDTGTLPVPPEPGHPTLRPTLQAAHAQFWAVELVVLLRDLRTLSCSV